MLLRRAQRAAVSRNALMAPSQRWQPQQQQQQQAVEVVLVRVAEAVAPGTGAPGTVAPGTVAPGTVAPGAVALPLAVTVPREVLAVRDEVRRAIAPRVTVPLHSNSARRTMRHLRLHLLRRRRLQ